MPVVVGEIEVLQFRSQITGVAFLRGLGQHALQGIAGVARIGGAVGLQDVAEHPGHGFLFRAPGQDLEGGGVGLGDHVAFFNAGKSLDGGPVKAHPLSHGLFQFGRANGKAFQHPQDVGEPDLDKAYLFIPDNAENILCGLAGLAVHGIPPEQKIYIPHSNYYTRLIFKENQKLNQTTVYIIVDLAKKMLTRLSIFLADPGRKIPG